MSFVFFLTSDTVVCCCIVININEIENFHQ